MTVDFSTLGLPAGLLESLGALGFTHALPVQAQALPAILEGRDVLVRSQTGSGKTVAFALGLLARLEPRLDVQALVMCPTRELAEQLSGELRRLARRMPNVKVLTLGGGVPFAPQRASLKQGAHVVVGTPGRLEEHVRKASLSLAHVKVLVLDEADRMLDMGFEPQIAQVIEHVPSSRQTLLFSATYPKSIAGMCRRYQRNAVSIDVPDTQLGDSAEGRVEQRFIRVDAAARIAALAAWLGQETPESALVFCNTRAECNGVSDELCRRGWSAACIHGEMAQRERQHVMRLFANGSCSVLAATDVAARGWDIADLPVVINLGLSRDPTQHLHRSGRTGRVGRGGLVVNLVAEEDMIALEALERARNEPIELEKPPAANKSASRPPFPEPPLPKRVTLLLSAGKNKKLRPGDILGALTGEGGIAGTDVGMIHIDDSVTYVAVTAGVAERALARLAAGIKGRSVKGRVAGLTLQSGGQ